MATSRQQAQAEVSRMESELRAAQRELDRVLAKESEYRAKGLEKVMPARSAVKNAERALDLARDELRKCI